MSLTWAILSGRCNGEGNIISLRVRVSGPSNEIAIPDWDIVGVWVRDPASDLAGKIQTIVGWRFDEVRARLSRKQDAAAADGGVARACIIEFDRAVSDAVGGGKQFEFTYSIELKPGAKIASGNAQGAVYIRQLTNEGGSPERSWVELYMPNVGTARGPTMHVDAHPHLRFDTGTVGRMLNHHAYCTCNSHNEWAALDLPMDTAARGIVVLHDQSLRLNSFIGASSDDKVLPVLEPGGDPPTYLNPHLALDSAAEARFTLPNPPVNPGLGSRNATIAALIRPGSTGENSIIVARYNSGDPATGAALVESWKLTYSPGDAGVDPPIPRTIRYTTKDSGQQVTTVTVDLLDDEPTVLVVFRRDADGDEPSDDDTYSCWINGRLVADALAGLSDDVAVGGGPIVIGARGTSQGWTDAFEGEINEVQLFSAPIDNLKVSLLIQQMACRGTITLGTPIPPALHKQPQRPGSYQDLEPERVLDRRPIAVITLFSSNYSKNVFGQSDFWRRTTGSAEEKQAAVEAWLRGRIREILLANDQFEIMFNRPGGQYDEDIVPSYVFGSSPASLPPRGPSDATGAVTMIEDYQWAALKTIFDEFNLDSYNDRGSVNANGCTKRRAWFYTGGGLPINDDGSLNTHGYMHNRMVGPVHGRAYYNHYLINWPAKDDRFRCILADASVQFYGLFVQALHDETVYNNITMIGEAIPTDEIGRRAAPWFAFVRFAKAPWWHIDMLTGEPNVSKGYNWNWSTDPRAMPTYFGVISNGDYSDLNAVPPATPGSGSDLTFSQVYSWVQKGATPVAWNGGYKKIGDAWNVGSGRVMPSRQDRSMRLIRRARA